MALSAEQIRPYRITKFAIVAHSTSLKSPQWPVVHHQICRGGPLCIKKFAAVAHRSEGPKSRISQRFQIWTRNCSKSRIRGSVRYLWRNHLRQKSHLTVQLIEYEILFGQFSNLMLLYVSYLIPCSITALITCNLFKLKFQTSLCINVYINFCT